MEIQLADILDRLSILTLKRERIGGPEVENEYEVYNRALTEQSIPLAKSVPLLAMLYDVNRQIWDLEAAIRKGKEGLLGLEEVGRRAIEIRTINAQRISIKNQITEAFGGFKEVRTDHGSVE